MNIRKMTMAAALLVAGFSTQAAELTLYQHQDFGGSRLTLRGQTPNVGDHGFNDQTSSIAVRSGRWLLCTDAGFKGHCAEFAPGDYPRLDGRFNNRISSAREIGARGEWRGRDRDRDRDDQVAGGAIKFFSERAFHGRSQDMQRDHADFREFRYNDRAASIVVTRGVWELCTDAGYRGRCRLYGPGHYEDLEPGMSGRISSGRLVRPTAAAPAPDWRGDRHARNDDTARRWSNDSSVQLYSMMQFSGASRAYTHDVPNLHNVGFNDVAQSIIIHGGDWELCSDAGYGGNCTILRPGAYAELGALAANLSSLRRVR